MSHGPATRFGNQLRSPTGGATLAELTGNVVGGGLALSLDENRDVGGVLAVPCLEGLEDLKTIGRGRHGNLDRRPVLGRSLVCVGASVEAVGGKTLAGRGLELELVAVLVLEGVGERVEAEGASNRHGGDQVGGGDEGVGGRVGVVTTGEVTVVGRDDRVLLTLLDVAAVPLTC